MEYFDLLYITFSCFIIKLKSLSTLNTYIATTLFAVFCVLSVYSQIRTNYNLNYFITLLINQNCFNRFLNYIKNNTLQLIIYSYVLLIKSNIFMNYYNYNMVYNFSFLLLQTHIKKKKNYASGFMISKNHYKNRL